MKRSIRKARYIIYRQTIVEPEDHIWTFIGAFLGIGLIGWIQSTFLGEQDNVFLIGSFGATAVLVFGATNSPLAQPRNLIFGHLVLPDVLWLSAALSVSLAIVVMQITKTMHPPGGATALIATIGSEKIKALGYLYVLTPVMSGVVILLIVALLINNLPRNRHYPYRRKL